MQRDRFTFFESFWRAIEDLPRDVQGDVLIAIVRYGIDGVTSRLSKPISRSIFEMARPVIDKNKRRGAPMGNHNAGKHKDLSLIENNSCTNIEHKSCTNIEHTLKTIRDKSENNSPKDMDMDKDMDNKEITLTSVKESDTGVRFVPPTPSEVRDYMLEYIARKRDEGKCFILDDNLHERFCNFYESKGWLVGAHKMKDWRASARNWIQDGRQRSKLQDSAIHFEGENDRSVYAREAEYVRQLQGG